MVLLFFALDLPSLSPPLFEQVKQCLLELANLYALTSPLNRRNSDSSVHDNIGLCYLNKSANSPSSDEHLKVAYSPKGRGFNLHDFHYAINLLPSDPFFPSLLDDPGSFPFSGSLFVLSHFFTRSAINIPQNRTHIFLLYVCEMCIGMNFSHLLSDEVLYCPGDREIERKIILITANLIGNMDSNVRNTLQDAADRCVSMEFVFLEQKSSQLIDISENIAKFKGQICDLENCSFNAYLPDSQVFNGMVKRWFRELKDDKEEYLEAHFVFQRNIAGSINQISCKLCNSINQLMDVSSTCKACRVDGFPWDGADGSKSMECPSCHVAKHDLALNDTEENSMKVGEHASLIQASWRSWMNLREVACAVNFDVTERTGLASLSEGVVVGRPYIIVPSLVQEINAAPEESEKCQLNNQLFHGLCRALHSVNQGLVCRSFCNIETMRQTAFYYHYILHPSDSGLMLLRRLAGAEELLPFPDVYLSDSSTTEDIDNCIKECLQVVELRDYNPVQHSGGFHLKFNQLIQEILQARLVNPPPTTTASDPACRDRVELSLQSSMLTDIAAPQAETHVSNKADEHNKGIACLTEEWEQLIVSNIPKMDPPISEPKMKNLKTSPLASQKPVDTRTSKILERLGNPKQMKAKGYVTNRSEWHW